MLMLGGGSRVSLLNGCTNECASKEGFLMVLHVKAEFPDLLRYMVRV